VADTPPTLPFDVSRARYDLELFLLGGTFDLYEDGHPLGTVDQPGCGVEVSFGKLIFSCWSEQWSKSWKVVGCAASVDAIRLDCTRQMGRIRCTLDLRRCAASIDSAHSRAEYSERLSAMIASQFPDLRVKRAVIARDDVRHLSGAHTRLVMKEQGRVIAGIGIGEAELQASIDASLGAGLIWMDALRSAEGRVSRLMIFAPRKHAATIATRLTLLKPEISQTASLFEVDEKASSIEPVAAFDQGDLADNLRRAGRRALWWLDRSINPDSAELVHSVVELAPELIESNRRGSWIVLSIRGLEVARVSTNKPRVEFGFGEARQRLSEATRDRLQQLVSRVIAQREGTSTSRDEFIFRAQGERWLESEIRRNAMVIDPTLDPRYCYSQVPAYRGEQRTFIDLLTVTRDGRLVVIELKVSEDSEFPFQALDYWLRVEWHRSRGDFERRGYFAGVRLIDSAPLLFLVAPLFRFHTTTKLIGSSISERVPLYRVGINEDWRTGVHVRLTERLNY
jgi:hypothetical protein